MFNDRTFGKIRRLTGKAVGDFNLVEEGDRILVAISGGKDSYTLLHVMDALRRRAPVRYDLVPVTIHPGFEGFRTDVITAHLHEHGFHHHVEEADCSAIIDTKLRPGSSYCAFCARLRRGVLYSEADRLGCNKVALGHHLDDFVETLLLNQFYVGRLAAMSPRMLADNGRHTVIRPLVYVEEALIAEWSARSGLPTVNCACPAERMEDQKRQRMKQLVSDLSQENPSLRASMIRALANVQPRYLLDPTLSRETGWKNA